jgi:VWFA-related protein
MAAPRGLNVSLCCIVLVIGVLKGPPTWPQGALRAESQQPAAGPQFSVATQAVVLDVVVRDRRHRPIARLSVDDFEVRENGVRKQIKNFQAVHRQQVDAESELGDARTGRVNESPLEKASAAVAIVFENLGPEGRALAQQAALDIANTASVGRFLVGVYVVRRSLEPVLLFNHDAESVRLAITAAASRPGCPVLDASANAPGVRGGVLSACADMDDHRVRGVSTLDSLTVLVRDLGEFHGRKALALFSEGLDFTTGCRGQFCDDRKERLHELVAEAGRRNVAIYTFDAAGLRLQSTATGQLMAEPRAALTVLARDTGGVFSGDTNDLRPAVARTMSDLANYYMLGYDTDWPNEREETRKIDVRVSVKDSYVLARRTIAVPSSAR